MSNLQRNGSTAANAAGGMNGIAAIKSYVDRLVTGDGRCKGMKVLLLDAATTQIVSCATSQTEILSKEVYLVTRLEGPPDEQKKKAQKEAVAWGGDDDDEDADVDIEMANLHQRKEKSTSASSAAMSHLKAVVFCRPTQINIDHLRRELQHPRFSEYHLFFSGMISTGLLRRLADVDASHQRIKQVQEFYADFLAINEDLATLNCGHGDSTIAMTVTAGTAWARDHAPLYQRHKEGLSSILLALKRKPAAIRYQQSSPLAQQLAKDVYESMNADEIFHFRGSPSLLLILDRMDDPVTPLLSQWTYQAMVHELLGLNNNRIILKGAPGISQDLQEVVLTSSQDAFFHANRYANFGELGEAIKHLLEDFQKQTSSRQNLNSIDEMQQFMEKFPQIRSQSHNVSKHVALMGELARLVDVCSLMDVSQFEQELAAGPEDHSSHVRELLQKLADPNVQTPDKLRLGLLYALRYEKNSSNLANMKAKMAQGGVSEDQLALVDIMLRYAGQKVRGPGLYGLGTSTGGVDALTKMTKSFFTTVQGVANVYNQHTPVLMETLQRLHAKKLREATHPYVNRQNPFCSDAASTSAAQQAMAAPQEVIVFMAGGTTFEEATKVAEWNASKNGMKVFLAGSTIHNSTSFLEELKKL